LEVTKLSLNFAFNLINFIMSGTLGRRFAITYKNAGDNSFAEIEHRRLKSEAIRVAKINILLEHYRYGRDLNAEIKNEMKPQDPPIELKLSELLNIKKR
jgi:hypothetical protein